jgi:hypothetical protein
MAATKAINSRQNCALLAQGRLLRRSYSFIADRWLGWFSFHSTQRVSTARFGDVAACICPALLLGSSGSLVSLARRTLQVIGSCCFASHRWPC